MEWKCVKPGLYQTKDGKMQIRRRTVFGPVVRGKTWEHHIWTVSLHGLKLGEAPTLAEAKELALERLSNTAALPAESYLDNLKRIIRSEAMPQPPMTTWEDYGLPESGPFLEKALDEATTIVDVINVYVQCNCDHDHYDIIVLMAAAAVGKEATEKLVFGRHPGARLVLPEGLGYSTKGVTDDKGALDGKAQA